MENVESTLNKITLNLTPNEALELYKLLQKPNPIDDLLDPLPDIRWRIAGALGLDSETPKTDAKRPFRG